MICQPPVSEKHSIGSESDSRQIEEGISRRISVRLSKLRDCADQFGVRCAAIHMMIVDVSLYSLPWSLFYSLKQVNAGIAELFFLILTLVLHIKLRCDMIRECTYWTSIMPVFTCIDEGCNCTCIWCNNIQGLFERLLLLFSLFRKSFEEKVLIYTSTF